MIQWWRVRNNWKKPTKDNVDELKALLKYNIYGCDLEEEAVTLTYFSLGLALLDALSPKEIWKNVHFDNLIDPCVFLWDVEALLVKIWVKSTLGFVVCMGHVITYLRSFSGYVTNFCHDFVS